ncbi:MAG: RsiV family protein [Deltaproteobacteria bacterium]|nr:RsiV family protein [Deltaproteobacteria bacterium]
MAWAQAESEVPAAPSSQVFTAQNSPESPVAPENAQQAQAEGQNAEDYNPEDDPYSRDGFYTPNNEEKKESRRDGPGNTIAPNLPKLIIKEVSRVDAAPLCPKYTAKTTVYYPAGTGAEWLDNLLAKEAKSTLSKTKPIFLEAFEGFGGEGQEICLNSKKVLQFEARRVFDAYSPKPGIISFLFTANIDTGGNHPSTEFTVATFNLKTGRELTVKDLFPNPEKSLPQFWEYIVDGTCAFAEGIFGGGATLPAKYGDAPCERETVPDPPRSFLKAKQLAELGNVTLTKDGLFIYLDPYECWGYVAGSVTVSYEISDLLEIGASPNLWAKKK